MCKYLAVKERRGAGNGAAARCRSTARPPCREEAQTLNRTTCGSWSLAWSENSELTWTTW
ncbi:hypothetical protein GCM10009838_00300 [Catenulispora subtropica]|uniref:Uncharacterized protein n=1 Tax=Catenulispora subtropica TaxID=450798 RepID=A0ABP5BMS3_9ACTN